MTTFPASRYRERMAGAERARDALVRRSQYLSRWRVIVAVAILVGLGMMDARGAQPAVSVVVLVLAAVFLVLVLVHRRLRRRQREVETRLIVNREAVARLERRWDDCPVPGVEAAPADHPYARDLDILGRASLIHLLGSVRTEVGTAVMRDWLLCPAEPAVIGRRQAAVRELAVDLEWRQGFEVAARALRVDPAGVEQFLRWAESGPWLATHPWLVGAARAMTVLSLTAIGAVLAGAVPWITLVLPIGINLAVTAAVRRPIHAILAQVGANDTTLGAYALLLSLVAGTEREAEELTRLRDLVGGDASVPRRALHRLRTLVVLGELRFSMMYAVFQWLFLWDVHVLHGLERWREQHGARARRWLQVVGEIEALAALAGLAADHPDWTMPTVTDAPRVEARAVGHPLLRDDVCVRNDVEVGPPGSFLLITGSNMSGKSTLLRAIGVNTVLAGAGGPVCAAAFSTPPVRLHTSLRIEDSLETGTSYFLAALKRLKGVVDAAREPGATRVLYLLDEMLQGTNSAERRVAVQAVIAELVQCGAIGMVTTHDLALAHAPALEQAERAWHFSETIVTDAAGDRMVFDYTLRPGVATSTNALRLMQMIGLTPGPAPHPEG